MLDKTDDGALIARRDFVSIVEALYCDCTKPFAIHLGIRKHWLNSIDEFYNQVVGKSNNYEIILKIPKKDIVFGLKKRIGENYPEFYNWLICASRNINYYSYYFPWEDILHELYKNHQTVGTASALEFCFFKKAYESIFLREDNHIDSISSHLYPEKFELTAKDWIISQIDELGYVENPPTVVTGLKHRYRKILLCKFWNTISNNISEHTISEIQKFAFLEKNVPMDANPKLMYDKFNS